MGNCPGPMPLPTLIGQGVAVSVASISVAVVAERCTQLVAAGSTTGSVTTYYSSSWMQLSVQSYKHAHALLPDMQSTSCCSTGYEVPGTLLVMTQPASCANTIPTRSVSTKWTGSTSPLRASGAAAELTCMFSWWMLPAVPWQQTNSVESTCRSACS